MYGADSYCQVAVKAFLDGVLGKNTESRHLVLFSQLTLKDITNDDK